MPYEDKMSIQYDEINKRCIVHFRGEKHELNGKFESYQEAKQAGEQFCRNRGWKG